MLQSEGKLLLREFLNPKWVIMEKLKNMSKHFKILFLLMLPPKRSSVCIFLCMWEREGDFSGASPSSRNEYSKLYEIYCTSSCVAYSYQFFDSHSQRDIYLLRWVL